MKNSAARLIDENGPITIPVVVHIIHRGESVGTGTNISDAQVQSQIDVLNEDYNRLNPDRLQTRSEWAGVAGNPQVNFRLACRTPSGQVTNGITRRASPTATTIYSIATDNIKFTSQGGQDAWATDRYLNIWIAPQLTSASGLAYATYPDEYVGAPEKDGIVVLFNIFGRGFPNHPPRFSLGRIVTHEIGHWLNLNHIWGQKGNGSGCNDSDDCDDTPNQDGPNNINPNTCPTFPHISCNNGPNGDMFQNYMDYTDDICKNIFTRDQSLRMRSVFQTGGVRRSFIDNYFKLVYSGYRTCVEEFDFVASPFCEAAGNITWSITGPASLGFRTGFSTYVNPWQNANGTATLTASWNNFTSDLTIPVGYAVENSTGYLGPFNPNAPLQNVGYYAVSNNISPYGSLSFTGATGVAKNWRIHYQSGQNTLYGSGNSFNLYLDPYNQYALATIRAEIPTSCGDRTVQYTFYKSGSSAYRYALSPNPASNNITVSMTNANPDPNARMDDAPEYEIQILSRFSQLLKRAKCPKGNRDMTVDVSNLPSNQLYTVRLISNNDVQTKTFFKE
jgi:Pregnancy-associated plasma protein-A